MRIVYGDITVEIEPGEEERAAELIRSLQRLLESQRHQMGTRVNVPPEGDD
jgi:hypothetical protein